MRRAREGGGRPALSPAISFLRSSFVVSAAPPPSFRLRREGGGVGDAMGLLLSQRIVFLGGQARAKGEEGGSWRVAGGAATAPVATSAKPRELFAPPEPTSQRVSRNPRWTT